MQSSFIRAAAGALVGALALLAVSPEPAASPAVSAGDATFTALAAAYFADNFRAQPVNATQTGVHDYDMQLGSYGAADYAAQLARDRSYLARAEAIDPATLSPAAGLDRAMLMNALRDDLLINGHMRMWQKNVDNYVQTASGGVFILISKDFAPKTVRLRDTIARENQLPKLYAQARANLTSVDKDSAELAADDAAGTVDFFATTVPQAFAGVGDSATRAAFKRSTATAVASTRAFAAWVKARWVAHPTGTYAIGAANYSARLKYEEGVDLPLDRYLAVGVAALADTHAKMVALAHEIDPNASTEATLLKIEKIHPTAAQLIPASQADLVKLRAFVIDHHILDLPSDANIRVTLTPEFERQTTIASMDAPGPLETVATQAYYNVTPVDPKDKPAVQESYLETFNDFERPIVSAHEVYPGHFANFVIDKHLPLSLCEKLLTATSFVEGWAHYDEQMMVDEGWGGGDKRVRLMQLREAILRNARYVVGVKLHTQGMTLKQAQQFFITQAFLDPASARIESRRGTADATYGYYTLGKLMIFKLRADYQKHMGSAYTLAGFHKALLSYGDPELPLLRPLLLGKDDDGKILSGL
jgi:uncharacterized protein (DUF885 family)